MREVYEFLKKCGTFYLATDDEGQPRVRPFGAINVFEDKLYIQTGKAKKVSRQMKQNPKVEICGMTGEKWIRISAEAVLDERVEAQSSLLDAYPDLKAIYQPGDGNTEVFYLKNAEASICSFTEETRIIHF